ncbi:MAG: hypothetical protein J0M26_24755 [Planctomycetes bacterium]|nr:hypothetical protein [Planctomycetota bacterium]
MENIAKIVGELRNRPGLENLYLLVPAMSYSEVIAAVINDLLMRSSPLRHGSTVPLSVQ